MPNISFRCPNCDELVRSRIEDAIPVRCSECENQVPYRSHFKSEKLLGCMVCGSSELFVRKDFPQRLGVLIVAIGIGLSCVAYAFEWIYTSFAILFATALVDVVLYFVVGNVLECYRCHAHYRDLPQLESHDPFDLETHEKHRQQAARLNEHHQQNLTDPKKTVPSDE